MEPPDTHATPEKASASPPPAGPSRRRSMMHLILDGFRTVHRTWPLVLIQAALWLGMMLAMGLLVLLPLAAVALGSGIVQEWGEGMTLERFLAHGGTGLLLLGTVLFLVWLTVASLAWLFVTGGNLAVLADAAAAGAPRFVWTRFWEGGKRFFWPLCWLFLAWGGVMLGVLLVFGGFVGLGTWGIHAWMGGIEERAAVALVVVLGGLGVLLLLGVMLVLAIPLSYSMVILAVDRLGGLEAFWAGWRFVRAVCLPSGGFFLLLVLGLVVANLGMSLVSLPFTLIPVLGTLLSIPINVAITVVQLYLSLVMTASLIHFYRQYRPVPRPQEASP